MARKTLNVKITLDEIHCRDEGDGWGNAEEGRADNFCIELFKSKK